MPLPTRYLLALLLTATLLEGLIWSILIPPWHAPDESTHFSYAQMIQRDQTLHPSPTFWRPWEIGISWELAQIRRVRYQPHVYLDLTDRAHIAAERQRLAEPSAQKNALLDDPPWTRIFRVFTYSHPPLYHFWISLFLQALQDQNVLVRILASRWFSASLGVLLAALSFRIGQIVFQSDAGALGLATLVGFQPMIGFIMGIVNNNSLEIVLFSACLLALLGIWRGGLTWRRATALGILLGAGLLTRTSLFAMTPLLLVVFARDAYHLQQRKRWQWRRLAPWGLMLALPLALAGWWYSGWSQSDTNTMIGALDNAAATSTTGLFARARAYDWLGVSKRLAKMYWGNFGWLDTPLPAALTAGLIALSALPAAATFFWTIHHARDPEPNRARRARFVLFLGLAILSIGAFYFYLGLLGGFGLQGRYFLPPIVAQMVWLLVGAVALTPARWRWRTMWFLSVGMIALNLYALFSVVALRYYGARNLWLVAERATILQPVPAQALLVLVAIYFVTLAIFVAAFWRTLKREKPLAL